MNTRVFGTTIGLLVSVLMVASSAQAQKVKDGGISAGIIKSAVVGTSGAVPGNLSIALDHGYKKFVVTVACVNTPDCAIFDGKATPLAIVSTEPGGAGTVRDRCLSFGPGLEDGTTFTCRVVSGSGDCICRLTGIESKK